MNSKVVVFSCNWDGWSCVGAASSSGLRYPASVRVIRVSCLSRIHAGLILKAFEFGADGVILLGCEPGRCQFDSDSQCVNKEFEKARSILEILGMSTDRLKLVQLPAFQGERFVEELTGFIKGVEKSPASRREKADDSKVALNAEVSPTR